MVHHTSLTLLLPIYFLYQKGDLYIAASFLQNASTPLLHGRYMLLKSHLKGSALHKCCAVSLLVVFFAVRILLWPLLFAVHSYDANIQLQEMHHHFRWYCFLTSATMGAMNTVWWITLVRKITGIDLKLQYQPQQGKREENTAIKDIALDNFEKNKAE
jgi:hypothetical protein